MKGQITIDPIEYKNIPPFKPRREHEMEELLHRYKVIAKRRQLEDKFEVSNPKMANCSECGAKLSENKFWIQIRNRVFCNMCYNRTKCQQKDMDGKTLRNA